MADGNDVNNALEAAKGVLLERIVKAEREEGFTPPPPVKASEALALAQAYLALVEASR